MTTLSSKRWLLGCGLVLLCACKDDLGDAPVADPLDDPWVDAIEAEDEALAVAAPVEPVPEPPAHEPGLAPAGGETEGALAVAPADDTDTNTDTGEASPEREASGSVASPAGASAQPAAAPAGSAPEPAPVEGEGAEPELAPTPTPAAEPAPAPAAEPAPAPAPAPITTADFDGSYRYAGGSSQRSDLTAAIEKTVQALSPVLHKLARRRLTETNQVDSTVDISISGDKITITFASGFSVSSVVDGAAVKTKGLGGEKLEVRVRSKGSKLVQHMRGKGGARTIVFVLSSDRKRLTVHHKITSPRLPVPVVYRLSYARK